ncbi:MAG: MFS transporter [Candidatus Aenigmarchaeota archaeon]|nr:MFS transporter [Candidatus Aenigmarchaeota archaeon]
MEKEKGESLLLNLALNIFLPVVILTKLTGEGLLGPLNGLLLALSLPIGYGIYDYLARRKLNLISALGVASVLMTGAIGVLQLDPGLVAIKEAGVPAVIGLAVLVSVRTPWPFVKKLSEKVLDMEKVQTVLKRRKTSGEFERVLSRANYMVAGTFFLSSALNYHLARAIVVSQPGTVAFNEEIGTMTALSYPVIALPSAVFLILIIWYLISRVGGMTGMKVEKIIKGAG